MAVAASQLSEKARDAQKRELAIFSAYDRLFFVNGKLREDAQIVLDDLSRRASLGQACPSLDHAELAAAEGARRLLYHIFNRFRLSGTRLEALSRQLHQEEVNE